MTTIDNIESLAMLKMEKNFVAHNDKGYPRQPYAQYDINDHFGFVEREYRELKQAFLDYHTDIIKDNKMHLMTTHLVNIRNEIADVSNTLDYFYELCLRWEKILPPLEEKDKEERTDDP